MHIRAYNARMCRAAATAGEQTCTAHFRVRQLRVVVLVMLNYADLVTFCE